VQLVHGTWLPRYHPLQVSHAQLYEVQMVRLSGTDVTAGTFTLRFNGEVTPPFDVAATLGTALQANPNRNPNPNPNPNPKPNPNPNPNPLPLTLTPNQVRRCEATRPGWRVVSRRLSTAWPPSGASG